MTIDCNNLLMDEYFREVPTNIDRISNGNNVNGLGINPYIMSFLDTSQIGITTHREQIRKEWNKVLLDQCCDFIHVISLKGVFLYVSRSATNMLEYDPQELIGNSLSRLCHPSDIIPVMHEIKEATTHPDKPISLLFRIRRKCSGYMWIDCRGKLHMDQNKGHKCLVLSGRERPVYRLLDNQITKLVGHEEGEYWAKLSLAGLYLYVTPTCKNVIGFTRDSLEHESIYQYIENEAVVDITNALRLVKEGSITKVLHTILDSKGNHVSVLSTFYPGDTLYNEGLPSFLLLQVKRLTHDSNQSAALTNIDTNAIDALLGQNIFGELETFRTTNWQYELYQLQQSNNRLREQLKIYSKPTNSRKRKVDNDNGYIKQQ
jgi:PAS domain S-box-containing protein